MKQLIIACSMLIFISFNSNAQTPSKTTQKRSHPKTEKISCCEEKQSSCSDSAASNLSKKMRKDHVCTDVCTKEGHHNTVNQDSTKNNLSKKMRKDHVCTDVCTKEGHHKASSKENSSTNHENKKNKI